MTKSQRSQTAAALFTFVNIAKLNSYFVIAKTAHHSPAEPPNAAGRQITRGNRQTLLYRLTRYSADLISVTLRREPENAADKNAVQVIAAVKGKGSAVMGYLNRQLAEAIAPLLDKGKQVLAKFEAVTGGAEAFLNYGLNVGISV